MHQALIICICTLGQQIIKTTYHINILYIHLGQYQQNITN